MDAPGTYVLFLRADEAVSVAVGALGECTFPPALYAYAGSALGPGGLAARVNRHLREQKVLHWHIDALTARLPVVHVHSRPLTATFLALPGTSSPASASRECDWVRRLLLMPRAFVPMKGFGSSDCRPRRDGTGGTGQACPAHLVGLPRETELADVIERLES